MLLLNLSFLISIATLTSIPSNYFSLPQGKLALHSPNTGIVDYAMLTRSYAEDFKDSGGHIYTGYEVIHSIPAGTHEPPGYGKGACNWQHFAGAIKT